MPRKKPLERKVLPVDRVMSPPDATLLDVLDHVLTKGVMATGDVTLGVAGVELIYLRLSALLCSVDRIMPPGPRQRRSRRRRS
jgi:gas vesicle protein GvpA/GvpJ/GvpM family